MALALLPPYHFNHHLQNPLPSPAVLLASAAMDQTNKFRPSLPSISSLIEAVTEQSEKGNASSPTFGDSRRISGGSHGHGISPERPRLSGSPRSLPPPTPELPPPSRFDLPRPSPTNTSPSSAANRSNFHQSSNPEFYAQRPSACPPVTESATTYPSSADSTSWPSSHLPRLAAEVVQPDQPPRPQAAAPSIEPRPAEVPGYNGLSQQRPLPTDFPGPIPGIGMPTMDHSAAPAWQLPRYYPSIHNSYPHNHERYICPTCHKPFSRPSSLKIHTYSHTGEKPYRCKYDGCGKYFSVRSNMKRHEKGCHGGEPAAARASSARASY
ncbi:uncharacterized protein Z520_06343 [Fonsecaea multimorphosa CBS 102226]|uniref:C2H2-type domain-containing protein n=1 Tax=Fonsecaea multimorphosa CBS 102226 TaxID=1442371 RepID=A0A0D2KNG9_9EURO|nr:uncharacterized protein Z520_06343 [Fonsecaea multimorphosa CBS 102226]KIX98263.1 hypothetical protein Z520_06343 [Fonsecaea multimorphosa CBS 102226]